MASKEKPTGRPPRTPERDHLEDLLDEALRGTFPASDPVAISIVEADEKSFASRAERKSRR